MISAPYLIVRFHEVALKGKNRPYFFRALAHNLEKATAGTGVRWVRPGHMMVLMQLEAGADWSVLKERLAAVFGANKYYPAHRLPPSLEEVKSLLARTLPGRRFSSFRITARREDKTFPKTSQDIMRLLEELHAQNQTIILVTHEPDIASHAARQVHLIDGKIARDFATEAKQAS